MVHIESGSELELEYSISHDMQEHLDIVLGVVQPVCRANKAHHVDLLFTDWDSSHTHNQYTSRSHCRREEVSIGFESAT